jgi:uncharacterized protein YodC (DUF2158 family)
MKIGDTVRLKSGGPLMTVSELLDNARVICTWFDNNELKTATFPDDSVEIEQDAGMF